MSFSLSIKLHLYNKVHFKDLFRRYCFLLKLKCVFCFISNNDYVTIEVHNCLFPMLTKLICLVIEQ